MDLTASLYSLLLTLTSDVYYQFPDAPARFPCIVFHLSASAEHARCGGAACLFEHEYTVDVYDASPEHLHTLSASADELLRGAGLRRTASADLYDTASRAHRRTAVYRVLADDRGRLYQ